MTKLLDFIEQLLLNKEVPNARHVVRVLHSILTPNYWKNQSSEDVKRLIELFHVGIKNSPEHHQYFEIRRGFEMCLRKMFEVISKEELVQLIKYLIPLTLDYELTEIAMLDFGGVLEFATVCIRNLKISEVIQPKVMDILLDGIENGYKTKSSLACQILARLLDQNDNFDEFTEPKIFFQNTKYKIVLSEEFEVDEMFLKEYKEVIKHFSNPQSFD